MTANRTRENRLSGMIGGLAETWAMVKAIRAHNAETPKQTSLHLRLRALHFYPDHFDLFNSVGDLPDKTNISIRIPAKNILTAEAWDDIRSKLRRCYNYLYNSLSKADSYVWIVASTNIVCNAARNLIKLSESPVPGSRISEEEGVSVLIEQQQHKNILVVAHKLLTGLSAESRLYKDVLAWLRLYEGVVRDAFPKLGELPSTVTNQFGSEVAFRASALSPSRRQLIFKVFDLVALITQIHPSESHNAA